MLFARRVFMAAGIYGLLVLLPQYLLETKTGVDFPPAITHPEYYHGFIGAGVAWQVAFLLIARDPGKLRPLMIPAVRRQADACGGDDRLRAFLRTHDTSGRG